MKAPPGYTEIAVRSFVPTLTMVLPAGDTHFSKDHYQITQQLAAYKLCKSFRRAIDVGAHVGYWSKNMISHFDHVDAFEPDPDNIACFTRNVIHRVKLHCHALGEHVGHCRVVVDEPTNSGAKHIELTSEGIAIVPLDMFKFTDVDMIKIDTQGYELPILKGARNTITKTHPLLVVEMPKRGGDPEIESLLTGWGYRVVHTYLSDWIWVAN